MILLFFLFGFTDEIGIFEIEESKDLEIILQDIEYLQQVPLDINTASVEQLSMIPYLSLSECMKIVEYRKESGGFDSIQDLLRIPGFDLFLLQKIKPYITTKMKIRKPGKFRSRLRFKSRLPGGDGAEEYYTKSEFYNGQYDVFLVTEKDPYESSFFDYYAAGILIDEGIRRFALGKYNLDLDPGVVLSPLGSFFNAMDFRLINQERGLISYTSVLENNGFFGAALSDSFLVRFTAFYSNQKLDGRIDSTGFARSFDETGDHTDSLSLSRKDRINEEIFGYDVRYRFSNLLLSNKSYLCRYTPPFVCADSFNDFYGDEFFISGLEMKYIEDFFVVFSEVARSHRNQTGGIFGFIGYLPYVDFNLAGKYFPAGFYSPKGVEAREDYLGGVLDMAASPGFIKIGTTLTLDNDIGDDSVRYGIKLNIEKRNSLVRLKMQFRVRFRERVKDLSGSRVFLRITPNKFIFFDVRLEEKYVDTETGTEKGLLGALEMGVAYRRVKLRGRYGRFDTDSYDARIFAYEIDLPGVINNRMLYQKGDYGFVYMSVKPTDFLKFTLKYCVVNRDTVFSRQFGCQCDITW